MLNIPDRKDIRFLETVARISESKGGSFTHADVHRFATAMQVLRNIEARTKGETANAHT